MKAGDRIRTDDIHVGNRLSSGQNRVLGVSKADESMRLLRVMRVDA
jgi:hypothetical protein